MMSVIPIFSDSQLGPVFFNLSIFYPIFLFNSKIIHIYMAFWCCLIPFSLYIWTFLCILYYLWSFAILLFLTFCVECVAVYFVFGIVCWLFIWLVVFVLSALYYDIVYFLYALHSIVLYPYGCAWNKLCFIP